MRDSVVRVSRRVEHRPQNGDEEQEGCEQQQVPQLDSELDAGRGVSTCSVTMAPPLRSPACPPPFCRARPAVIAEHCSRVPPRSLGQLGGRYAGRRMLLHPLPVERRSLLRLCVERGTVGREVGNEGDETCDGMTAPRS